MNNNFGQGAIEYLLIIAAAILVVAIVIIAVTGALGGGQGQTDTSTQSQGSSFAKLNLVNIEKEMVLYWKLNGNAEDYFINTVGVPSAGVSFVGGRFSSGAKFDVDGEYITAGKPVMVGTNFSYGGWVKFDTFEDSADMWHLVMHQDLDNNIEIYINTTKAESPVTATLTDTNIYCWDGVVNWKEAGRGYPITINKWYNVYCVHGGSKMCLWVNGEERDCWASTTIASTTEPFQIGGVYEGPLPGDYDKYYIKGTIDEVAVWNRTLTDSELKALYEIGSEIR